MHDICILRNVTGENDFAFIVASSPMVLICSTCYNIHWFHFILMVCLCVHVCLSW